MVADGDYTETVTGIEWSFTVANGVANVTGATPASGDIAIPQSFCLAPVVAVGECAFTNCTGLTSIVIPDGVTKIGRCAFADCSWLQSVAIPGSVTSIGADAFLRCQRLTAVHVADLAAWCEISFGNFYNANPLYNAKHLFVNGEEVIDLVIPDGVTNIKYVAFVGGNFRSVTIPSSMRSIGYSAFSCCSGLTAVHIHDLASWCKISFGANYDSNPLYHAGHLFLNGNEVTNLTIPSGTTRIGNYAFCGCDGLASVAIPDCVTSIGHAAFFGCTGLTAITIPDSVTDIGDDAFANCTSLENVFVDAGNPVYSDLNGVLFSDDGAAIIIFPAGRSGRYGIPDGVETIADSAFRGCTGLTSIAIPDSVNEIGSYAFSSCSKMTSITIPQALSSQSSTWGLPTGCEILIAENLKTLHVDAATGNDANDGLSWATAKASIQAAIDIATAGDTILVNDGRYEPISTGNKLIVIRSVNGAEATAIDASLQWPNGVTNRCATLGTANNHVKTVLSGFCLTNGIAANGGGSYYGTLTNCVLSGNTATNSGGGVYSGVLRDCIIFGNTATNYGGGAFSGVLHDCLIFGNTAKNGGGSYNGTLYNCIVSNNTTTTYGGGANKGTLRDCLIIGNTAKYGGGSYNGTLYNCTLSGNTATYNGGGSNSGTLNNCIVWDNTARTSNAVYQSTCQYSCLDQNVTGTGNVFANPMFVDAANGDFRLQPGSPCIDAGSNEYATGDTDIAGNPRILGSAVDMGAFEFDPNSLVADHTVTTPLPVPYSWLSTDAASILAAANGDYEAAANATAANGVNKVWECYVAGLDPTDTTARFEATITMDANGKPVISWNPPLPASEAAKREYRILGAKSLGGAWTDVTDMADPDAEGYRFFKVKVRMEE